MSHVDLLLSPLYFVEDTTIKLVLTPSFHKPSKSRASPSTHSKILSSPLTSITMSLPLLVLPFLLPQTIAMPSNARNETADQEAARELGELLSVILESEETHYAAIFCLSVFCFSVFVLVGNFIWREFRRDIARALRKRKRRVEVKRWSRTEEEEIFS